MPKHYFKSLLEAFTFAYIYIGVNLLYMYYMLISPCLQRVAEQCTSFSDLLFCLYNNPIMVGLTKKEWSTLDHPVSFMVKHGFGP